MKPYYQDDLVTIYHGDCREWMPEADVLVTDPPFGVNLGNGDQRPGHGWAKGSYLSYADTPENFTAVVLPAITEALSVVDRGVVFVPAHRAWSCPEPAAIGGVYIPAALGRHVWGFASFQPALLYGKAPDLNLGSKATVISSSARPDESLHPCARPLEWMLWAVALASRVRESVLDPFMGSGTTLVAAKSLGRKAIGIEIEERYCEIAANRCRQEVLGLTA
jgi:site-specific DNA-methyltransferase (adenine-specific)